MAEPLKLDRRLGVRWGGFIEDGTAGLWFIVGVAARGTTWWVEGPEEDVDTSIGVLLRFECV